VLAGDTGVGLIKGEHVLHGRAGRAKHIAHGSTERLLPGSRLRQCAYSH
jgi:hypothetical protein